MEKFNPPKKNESIILPDWYRVVNHLTAAMHWYGFVLNVIPILPGTKKIAVNYDTWHSGINSQKICAFWNKKPNYEIGFMVGDDIIVVDADSPEAVAALTEIETLVGITSMLVFKTTKGEQHCYRRSADATVKSASYSSEMRTDRLDIKTGSSLVILPPSLGVSLIVYSVNSKDELSEATPEFLEAIYQHNGRNAPSQSREPQPVKTTDTNNPLDQYYLRDIAKLEKIAVKQVLILGDIALLGQATVLYAKQNTGKTLITFHLIIEGIQSGKFDPEKLIYINMDDDSNGLAAKAKIAAEYGFQMVADGHNGFEAKKFRIAIERMIETDSAHGFIIILDTLKKFVNTMDKGKSSDFAKIVRQFVLKGGTVIALSHANKHPGSDGKTVYSGTTDIIDDFDCGYTLTTVSQEPDRGMKVVEFENIKRRGNVSLSVSYSYALERDISYDGLLLSVQKVDPEQVVTIKKEVEVQSDLEVVNAIETCIREGINTKMNLATAAAERTRVSKRAALNIIVRYTGHRWSYEVRERGAQVYKVLERPSEHPSAPSITTP